MMKKAFFLLVACGLLSGCALTTDVIDISYAPRSGASVIPGADGVVVSVSVNDQRQERSNKVSCKKNGFGMEMAPILANEDVTVTFQRAIEQELRSRGFKIGSEALVSVAADVTRFWNDHKLGFFAGDAVADLNLNVLVRSKDGRILYSRNIMAQGIEPNTQIMSGENARLALNKALENGMHMLFEDQAFFAALLDASRKGAS